MHSTSSFPPFRLRVAAVATSLALLLAAAATSGSADTLPPGDSGISPLISADLVNRMHAYVVKHHQAPDDYVISKFKDHDIIFLGESHRARQNLEFLQGLVPKLYAAGVYNLAFEFVSYADQSKVDSLLIAPDYDEALALDLLYNSPGLAWVTQEYADVFKAVWKLNHKLPFGAHRFRVVGVMDYPTTDKYAEEHPEKYLQRERMHLGGLEKHDAANMFWPQVISKEILAKDEKALVYCGFFHAFTKFLLTREDQNTISAGNFIYDYIHDRTLTLAMNNSFRGVERRPLDELFKSLPVGLRQAGVDVAGTPLGELPVDLPGYAFLSHRSSSLTLSDMVDGVVYLVPATEMKPMRFAERFITSQNWAAVERRWTWQRGPATGENGWTKATIVDAIAEQLEGAVRSESK
jgi:hypothetical protein